MLSFTKYMLAGLAAITLVSCDNNSEKTAVPKEAEQLANPLTLIEMTRFGGVEAEGFHNCFWTGPVSYVSYNIAYPDEGAVYWGARFELPEGASHLELEGKFPQARYFSFNTYDKLTQPIYALADVEIEANSGANPYSSADKSGGSYVVTVKAGEAPSEKEGNTLYLGSKERSNADLPLIWRIYVPEGNTDFTGGAGLPKVTLVMNDGSRHTGDNMCRMVGSPPPDGNRTFPTVVMKEDVYKGLITSPEAAEGFPGENPIRWIKFWGGDISVGRYIPGLKYNAIAIGEAESGIHPKRSGFYANIHNDYISSFINETFGELVVLEGKMPKIPENGWDIASGDYELRYWSLCTNENIVTTKYVDCKYDNQITLDDDRNYKIVISKKKNRPENATAACGVTWLDWGDNGDGAGDPKQGNLIIRNMLGDGFKHSIQNVSSPLSVERDMGEYFPKAHYTSKVDFETKGCAG